MPALRLLAALVAVACALACNAPSITHVKEIPAPTPPGDSDADGEAGDDDGGGDGSDDGDADAGCAPEITPTQLASAAAPEGVILAWQSEATAAYTFILDIQAAGSSTWAERARPLGTDRLFTDTTAARDTTYGYRLRATRGDCETPLSNEVRQQTLPHDPTLSCENLEAAAVHLEWTADNESVTTLRVDRRQVGGQFAELATPAYSATGALDDTTVTPARRYEYRLAAQNSAGEVTSGIADCWAPPAPPAALSVTSTGETSVTLAWVDTNDVETSYHVRRDGVTVAEVSAPPFSDTGLTGGQTYEYAVYALGGWPDALAQAFGAAQISGRARLRPALTFSSVALDDSCLLELQGSVAFDAGASPTPTFVSAAVEQDNAAWCTQGLAATDADVFCDPVSAGSAVFTWSATDSAGLVGEQSVTVTVRSVSSVPSMSAPVAPELARAVGMQPLDEAQVTGCDLSCDAAPLRGSIVAGTTHACVLSAAGGVRCWGENNRSQLGDGSALDRPNPVEVCATGTAATCVAFTGALALAGQGSRVCAVMSDARAKCWGNNGNGQVGDGTMADRSRPVSVCASGSGGSCVALAAVASLATGGSHTCALLGGGAVQCWGQSASGRLGNGNSSGTSLAQPNPVRVCASGSGAACPAFAGAVAITGGGNHTCALLAEGKVACWGVNTTGQLGDGTVSTSRANPVPVCASGSLETCVPLTGITSLAAGSSHTCALVSDGSLRCWGDNANGQLGDASVGAEAMNPVPVCASSSGPACPPLGGVVALAAGHTHTCALVANGELRCWGDNVSGQLGDGSQNRRLNPVAVCASGSGAACPRLDGAAAITAGYAHTCALLGDGSVACWGANLAGQLGIGIAGAAASTPRLVCASGAGEGCAGGQGFADARVAACARLAVAPLP